MESGHWNVKLVGEFNPNEYKGFIYKVVDTVSGMVYIGRKFFWNYKDKRTYWESYKTSSKRVNRKIQDGVIFSFYIIKLCKTREDTIESEIEELRKRDVLNYPNRYYNRCITSSEYIRDEESYKDPETRQKMLDGQLRRMNQAGWVHPMKGKVHPNKGKKMPQNAPIRHVTVDNIIITNGLINKYHPKREPIPEGWRCGSTQEKYELSKAEKQRRKEAGKIRLADNKKEYYKNPLICLVCKSPIEYEKRLSSKTCGNDACYRSHLSDRIKQREITWDTSQSGKSRMENIAKERGYLNYDEFAKSIIDFYKNHTNKETQDHFKCSWQMIYGSCKHIGFSKKKRNAKEENNQ